MTGLRREQFRRDHQRVERGIDLRSLVGVERQDAALLDQGPRQRLGEQPLRQPHVERLALALIAGLVLCRQGQRHVGAGIGVFAEILHGLADAVAGARIRQHQRKLRRLEQRARLRSLAVLCGFFGSFLAGFLARIPDRFTGAGGELGARFGDAVIVLELVGHLQRAAGLTFRILGQRDGRRTVRRGGEPPLRLAGRRADMRGAVAGDLELALAGAIGRRLARGDLGEAAADDDVDGAAARANQQRAAGRNLQRPAIGRSCIPVRGGKNDRRLAGIDRRRHPGIDPHIGRRQHAVPVERRRNPHPALVTGRDIGRCHHHHDQRAQRPGIVDGKPRRRKPGANPLDRGQRTLALLPPQRLRDRVLGRERIGQRGRGPVANAGAAVEPAQSLFAGRPAKTCERKQRRECQQNEQHDARGACNERQRQPKAGPGRHEKQSDDAQKPGKAGPGALPRDRILSPLQGLRQLKPCDSIRLARGL